MSWTWVILPQICGYTSWYGYLELLIARHILLSPLKFEASRVDCIWQNLSIVHAKMLFKSGLMVIFESNICAPRQPHILSLFPQLI